MEKTQRFEALDGLRVIFGFGIIIYHINEIFHLDSISLLAPVCVYGGYFGNYMFFILSGFLLSYKYKDRLGSYPLLSFLKKRLWRWYPAYFLSNLAAMFSGMVTLSPQRTFATFSMISTGWTSGQDAPYNFPSWFLCVLLICYILYFLLGKLSAHCQAVYPAICLLFIFGGGILEKLDLNIPFLYRVCGEGYLNFFLGALLAEILEPRCSRRTEGKQIKLYFLYFVCGFVLCAGAIFTVTLGFKNLPGDMRWWISFICASLVTIALLGGWITKILALPIFSKLSKYSLSLLLWHGPLSLYWHHFVGQLLDIKAGFVLYLMALAILSFVSCSCLEHLPRLDTNKKKIQ